MMMTTVLKVKGTIKMVIMMLMMLLVMRAVISQLACCEDSIPGYFSFSFFVTICFCDDENKEMLF